MKKLKKVVTMSLLGLALLGSMSVSVYAWGLVNHPSGGTHSFGVTQPGNGYEMGYSYYYHATRDHRSTVTYDGKIKGASGRVGPRQTALANGPSVRCGTVGKYNFYYDFCN